MAEKSTSKSSSKSNSKSKWKMPSAAPSMNKAQSAKSATKATLQQYSNYSKQAQDANSQLNQTSAQQKMKKQTEISLESTGSFDGRSSSTSSGSYSSPSVPKGSMLARKKTMVPKQQSKLNIDVEPTVQKIRKMIDSKWEEAKYMPGSSQSWNRVPQPNQKLEESIDKLLKAPEEPHVCKMTNIGCLIGAANPKNFWEKLKQFLDEYVLKDKETMAFIGINSLAIAIAVAVHFYQKRRQ